MSEKNERNLRRGAEKYGFSTRPPYADLKQGQAFRRRDGAIIRRLPSKHLKPSRSKYHH